MRRGKPPADATEKARSDREVFVLEARPARARRPAATVWQLRTYDPATQTPTGDLARRWHPESPRPDATVPPPVVDWVTTILGPNLAISVPTTYPGHRPDRPAWQIIRNAPDPTPPLWATNPDLAEPGDDRHRPDPSPHDPSPHDPAPHGAP